MVSIFSEVSKLKPFQLKNFWSNLREFALKNPENAKIAFSEMFNEEQNPSIFWKIVTDFAITNPIYANDILLSLSLKLK